MHLDEMVFRSIQEYKKKYKFVNIESSFEELSKDLLKSSPSEQVKDPVSSQLLPEEEVNSYCLWIKVK